MPATELPDGPLDDFARGLIRRKARRLAGRASLSTSDRDDVEQELTLALMARWPSFRPEKGGRQAFVQLVTDHAARALLRHRRAKKRGPARVASLSRLARTEGVPAEEAVTAPDDAGRRDLRLDLEALLARLPEGDRLLATWLLAETKTGLARRLGVPTSTLRSRLRRLRERFEAAGLRAYLPNSFAVSPAFGVVGR